MDRNGILIILLSSLVIFGVNFSVCNAANKLRFNFYKKSCPNAELIVRNITLNRAQHNSALGAKLLRMHFHDCFVRGCDASILLDATGNTPAEKNAGPNQSLSGFEVIDEIKTELEKNCSGIVSCADILALAARDAVSLPFKKPLWTVETGRRDGMVSLASDVNGNIPSPFSNFTTLIQLFNKKGLNINDLVVLSGGHTIGVAHCGSFTRRLYNFTGKGDTDPSLDKTYADLLKTKCPNPANSTTTVDMDPLTPSTFDKDYFNVVLQNKGLFQSDAVLLNNTQSVGIVKGLAKSNDFIAKFEISMKNMGAIGVLTGTAGQIRKTCRLLN